MFICNLEFIFNIVYYFIGIKTTRQKKAVLKSYNKKHAALYFIGKNAFSTIIFGRISKRYL